jgi:SAM-dependent methyltransferase
MHDANDRLTPARSSHAFLPLRHLAEALRSVAPRSKQPVLDLGSGARPYQALFPPRYIGLDLQATHGRPDARARAEQCPVRTGSIGTVLTTQQLEHVDDPATVLAEAHRVLRHGGTLLLSTHGVWAHHPDPKDLWRWTEEGLVALVAAAGFRVTAVHPLGGPVAAGALLATYPLAGLSRKGSRFARLAARGAITLSNTLIGPLDAAVERRAPRHYGSVGYLIEATRA